MYYFLLAVLTDNGQFALHQHTVVDHGMVMPAKLLTGREHILHGYQFGTTLEVVRQLYPIPALAGTDQFRTLYLLHSSLFLSFCLLFSDLFCLSLLAGGQRNTNSHCAANGKDGSEHPLFSLSHVLIHFHILYLLYLITYIAHVEVGELGFEHVPNAFHHSPSSSIILQI